MILGVVLIPRDPAPHQRLIVTTTSELSSGLIVDAVGAPVDFLIASRELLISADGVAADWATTGVYVLVGGPDVPLGPGDPIAAYDELFERTDSTEPPLEQ